MSFTPHQDRILTHYLTNHLFEAGMSAIHKLIEAGVDFNTAADVVSKATLGFAVVAELHNTQWVKLAPKEKEVTEIQVLMERRLIELLTRYNEK